MSDEHDFPCAATGLKAWAGQHGSRWVMRLLDA